MLRRVVTPNARIYKLTFRIARTGLADIRVREYPVAPIKPAVRPLADRVCSVLAVGQAQELPGRPVRSAIGPEVPNGESWA